MSTLSEKLKSDFRGRNDLSLGMRNNNPGNLRRGSSKWQGSEGDNGGFVVFSDISWGIRAFLINYYTQTTLRGRDTLEEFITVYAPPSENNTSAYISSIKAATGLTATSKMPTNRDQVDKLMMAIFKHENSSSSVSYINSGHIEEAYNRLSAVHRAFFLSRKIRL